MTSKTLRTTIYATFLTAAVFQLAVTIMAAIFPRPHFRNEDTNATPQIYFASFAAFFALLTFIWAVVLLCYNDRPFSKHPLTHTKAHLYSVTAIAAIWLAFSVMFSQQVPIQCGDGDNSTEWYRGLACGSSASAMALSWILFLTASVGVFSLFQLSKGAESDNVTWDDEIDMSRKPPVKSNTSSGTKMRTVLYALILAFGICEVGMGVFAGLAQNGSTRDGPPVQIIFGFLAVGFAMFSWIWASVLLAYNDRPSSTARLATVRTHLISAIVLVVVWLALAIMLTTEIPEQCNMDNNGDGAVPLWCSAAAVAAALAWILFLLSVPLVVSGTFVTKRVGWNRSVAGLK